MMKRKRVQSTMGEVLTNEAVLERLQKESTWRKEKEKSKKVPMEVEKTKKQGRPVKERLYIESMESSESDVDVTPLPRSDDESQETGKAMKTGVGLKDLKEGVSYVIVKYEGSYFPGIVKNIGKSTITVSCLVKSGPTSWKWPEREDSCDYLPKDIVTIIKPPIMGNRGQCSIPEADQYWC